MAIIRSTLEGDFVFEVDGLSPDEFVVTSFSGSEKLSSLYRFDIDLASENQEVDFDEVVGKKVVFAWTVPEGERLTHGIVARFEQVGVGRHFAFYRARLVPLMWTLGLRKKSRIFQNLSVPEIVKKVIDDAKVAADLYDDQGLTGDYKPREFCVQYRESDLEFILRLLEEEGIFFFFRQEEDLHVMVVGDDTSVHDEIAGEPAVAFRDAEFGVPQEEEIPKLRYVKRLRPGSVMLRDYDFKKPALDLSSKAEADTEADYEIYDYPGDYPDQTTGDSLAEVRLQELRTRRETVEGESNCRRLTAGYVFSVDRHPRADLNREFLVLGIRHWGRQPHLSAEEPAGREGETMYQNAFTCIPGEVPFRPPRITPRPRVEGPQTAIVVGPQNEEIHPDEHGRIKVQFHWDREGKKDDKSSCWIRVSQAWAGPGWGAMYLPRIGQEVVVDFLEGDPDRPLITGRVYNGLNPPPYPLAKEKTKSTLKSDTSPGGGGSNEIRFEDAKGKEEIYTHAQKDQNEVVENNMTTTVGNDKTLTVQNNRTSTIKEGDDKLTVSKGDRITEVSTGDETLTVKGDRTTNVTGDQVRNVIEGDHVLNVKAGDRVVNVGEGDHVVNVTTGQAAMNVKQQIELDSASAYIKLTASTEIVLQTGDSLLRMQKDGTITLSGKKVSVAGGQEAKLGVSNQNITCDVQKVAVSGASINSSAVGIHEIVGALVKIN